jgi:hypothetical protein
MRRFRTVLFIPAVVAVGAFAAMPHSAPVAAAGSGPAMAFCVINPVTDSGCLPVPCPSKLPFPCPEAAAVEAL